MSKLTEILKKTSTSIDLDIALDQDIIKAGMFQRVGTAKGQALIKHIAKFLHAFTFALQDEHQKMLDGQPADSGWDLLFTGDCSSNRKPDTKEKILDQMSIDDKDEIGQEAAVQSRIVSYGLGRSSRETGGGNLAKGDRKGVWAYTLGPNDTLIAHESAGNYDFDYARHEGQGPRDTISGLAHRENRVYETYYERKNKAGTFSNVEEAMLHDAAYWMDMMNLYI